jgi:hypothetical protein
VNRLSNTRSITFPQFKRLFQTCYLQIIGCKWSSLTPFLSRTIQLYHHFPKNITTCYSYVSLFTFLVKVLTKVILINTSSICSRMKWYRLSICLVQTPEEGFSAMKIASILSVLKILVVWLRSPDSSAGIKQTCSPSLPQTWPHIWLHFWTKWRLSGLLTSNRWFFPTIKW